MLESITNWFKEQFQALWEAFAEFMGDFVLMIFKNWLGMVYMQWSLVPVPDFLSGYSMCTLLSSAGPTVGWALNTFKVGEALGLIGAAYSFRMVRKLATLFQW